MGCCCCKEEGKPSVPWRSKEEYYVGPKGPRRFSNLLRTPGRQRQLTSQQADELENLAVDLRELETRRSAENRAALERARFSLHESDSGRLERIEVHEP